MRSARANTSAPASSPMAAFPSSRRSSRASRPAEGKGAMVEEAVTADHVAQVVSRWTGVPGRPDAGRREGEAPAHGGAARQARHRPGRGGQGGVDRGAPRARRPAGSAPADRLVHVPGPDRRRQDRAHQGARRIPVRRRARAGAPRHVGIHGEAFGRPPDRRAARLCRLRGGRRARPRRCGGGPTRWCCSTRSRRRTRTSSTCCCRCSTTAASPTGRATPSTSATR